MPTHPSQHPHFCHLHLLNMGVLDWLMLHLIQQSRSNHLCISHLSSSPHFLCSPPTLHKQPSLLPLCLGLLHSTTNHLNDQKSCLSKPLIPL
uniref:Putative ovule protein n=1 Tax=Solanum chacoense TaxID=4108 RepID=A0A0V0HEY0_SOLCH